MVDEIDRQIREDLHDWVRDLFEGNIFEICNNHRGIYRVWALGTDDLSRREELVVKFKEHFTDLRARGGVALFWRRKIELTLNNTPRVYLKARFVVWDIHGNEVKWPEGSEAGEDGLALPLMPS